MTPLEKHLHRECPEIVNDEGRALQVSLLPDDGGTLRMKWKGLGRFSEIEAPLAGLVRFFEKKAAEQEEPEEETPEVVDGYTGEHTGKGRKDHNGVDVTQYCSYPRLLSCIHVLGDVTYAEKLKLIDAVKQIQELQIELTK